MSANNFVNNINSPYLKVYPDIGNVTNATDNVAYDLRTGKGNEFGSQIHPPGAVGRHELVVYGRLLLLHGKVAGCAGEPGGRRLHALGILGELRADGLLEFVRHGGADGQNLGETQLTDHLSQLVVTVNAPGFL